MTLKLQNRNVFLGSNAEPTLFYSDDNILTFIQVNNNFHIINKKGEYLIAVLNQNYIVFLSKENIVEEFGNIIPTLYYIYNSMLYVYEEKLNFKLSLKFRFNRFVFVEDGDLIELYENALPSTKSLYFNDNIIQKRNDKNIPLSNKNISNDNEYNILKHIFQNDRSIIPEIYKLSKLELSMESYQGDLSLITPDKYCFIANGKPYLWDGDFINYLMDKIKSLIKKLIDIDIYHCDLSLEDIVFKIKDYKKLNVSEIDIRIINFGSSSFLSNSFDQLRDNINSEKINTKEDLKIFLLNEQYIKIYNLLYEKKPTKLSPDILPIPLPSDEFKYVVYNYPTDISVNDKIIKYVKFPISRYDKYFKKKTFNCLTSIYNVINSVEEYLSQEYDKKYFDKIKDHLFPSDIPLLYNNYKKEFPTKGSLLGCNIYIQKLIIKDDMLTIITGS